MLSHSSKEQAFEEFAARIAAAVRDLGLHHPGASAVRFLTVSCRVGVVKGAAERGAAGAFLDRLLASGCE